MGVPLYEYQGQRDTLTALAKTNGPDGMDEYRRTNNATSLDGLTGLEFV